MTTSPQVVFIVIVQVLPWASDGSGAEENCSGLAGAFTVGAGHGFAAAAAPGDAEPDAAGEAEDEADGEALEAPDAEALGDVEADATVPLPPSPRFSRSTAPPMTSTTATAEPATMMRRRCRSWRSLFSDCLCCHSS
jgi:hypothetical protein